MTLSVGELVELRHRLKAHMQPHLDALKREIRASPALQADETGWREDGLTGYIWAVSTPSLRYYEDHHSRGGEVLKELIGEDFGGVLGSDFYAGYPIHQGLHQRWWVHFLRDVHALTEQHPHDEQLLRWAKSLKALSEEAVAGVEDGPDQTTSPRHQRLARVAQQHAFEQRLWQLCAPYVNSSTPMQTLCKRVEKFLPEVFVLVAFPGFQPIPIWRSAVFARSSWPAKSVGELAVLKAPRPVWDSPVSLAPGWHNASIPSTNVWLPSP